MRSLPSPFKGIRNFSIQPMQKDKLNMTTNRSTSTLSNELAAEAHRLLTTARDNITQAITDDLTALLRASETTPAALHEFPEDTPSWVIIAALESAMPDGAVCWDIARAHLTIATATRLACALAQDASQELREATDGATCYALAQALGVNLYEFSGEVWASMADVPAMLEAA